ncbi:DegV domain-containing protein [Listeria floridensis FSL S10-1187]|uniref:DegV domain-containing protein n=1 Tax=Listeria floridensis FSL S10-1187 TaxID=1265817 RepID=A0ABP3B171_9LIST|nr:DegV domain-containing protein [Listeria floridensis FSL S10-1187]
MWNMRMACRWQKLFKRGLKKILGLGSIPIFDADPVVATHAGNGAFAVMYYTE